MAKITFGTNAVNIKAYPYEDDTNISKSKTLDFFGELRKIEKKCHKHNMIIIISQLIHVCNKCYFF